MRAILAIGSSTHRKDDVREPQFAAGAEDGFPTLFRSLRLGQGFLAPRQREMRPDHGPDIVLAKGAGRKSEFAVAQILDGEIDAGGKDSDCGRAADGAGRGLGQSKHRQSRGDTMEREDEAGRRETPIEKPVMNMIAVRAEKRLAPQEPAENGNCGVEQRNRKSDHGSRHSKQGRRLLRPDHAGGSENKSNQQAAAISKEDGCGMNVISKKTDECRGKNRRDQDEDDIALDQAGPKNRESREESQTSCESIGAVDQVERVRASDEPDYSQRPAQNRRYGDRTERVNRNAPVEHQRRRADLPSQFLPGPQRE